MGKKFDNDTIEKVRNAKRRGLTYREIGEKFDMTIQHAYFICKNRSRIDAKFRPITRRPLNVQYCVEQYKAGKNFNQIRFLEALKEFRQIPYHRDTIRNAVLKVLGD